MVSITVQEVQDVYGEKETSLDTAKKEALRDIAERMAEQIFGGQVSRQSEIEGDEEDFTRYVAAHLWEISERKRLNQEFQTGFDGDVQAMQSDPNSALSGTPYGNMALTYLRDRASIGVVRSF